MNDIAPNGFLVREWEGRVCLPEVNGTSRLSQAEEWCQILENGQWKRLRFHDYGEIYRRPGLYEHLFYGMLECRSPSRVVGLLDEVRRDAGLDAASLRVLDLGAGNGIVAQRLRERGIRRILGVDILPEAKQAAQRDRPGVYDDYLAADLLEIQPQTRMRLREFAPTALTCVAALGFGDIPARLYYNALDFVSTGGLLAFNIKADFLDPRYSHGFSALIRRMVDEQYVRLEATRRYRHRMGIDGRPLHYTAMVATKLKPVPESMLVDA
jgi:SAM-dependent methyltransferase